MYGTTERNLPMLSSQFDRAKFGELVPCHQSRNINLVYRMLGSRRAAEESAEEDFNYAAHTFYPICTGRPILPWHIQTNNNVV